MNMITLDRPGEPRCSNLSVPLFIFEDIEQCLRNYLDNLSRRQWTAIATDNYTLGVVDLLTKMCRALIEHISALLLEVIHTQVTCCPHNHDRGDKGRFAKRMNAEPLLDGCSYCRVTEDDIEASLGNIFDKCFGWALDFSQRRSCDSDNLLTLFSVPIAKNVNSALRRITGSTSLQSDRCTSPIDVAGMVYSVVIILKDYAKTVAPPSVDGDSSSYSSVELPDFLEDDDFKPESVETFKSTQTQACVGEGKLGNEGNSDTFQIADVQNLDHESSESKEKCSDVELLEFLEDNDFKPESVKTFKSTRTQAWVGEGKLDSKCNSDTFQITDVQNFDYESSDSEEKCSDAPQCSSGTLPMSAEIDTFLSLCLAKLVVHVSKKTRTSAVKLNFQQIVTDIREKICKDLTPLKTVKNLYIIMYKDLCRKFGSKHVVLFVMEKGDPTFVAAIVELLKVELKKLAGLESNKSISQANENKTQQCVCEDKVQNGSTDSRKDRPRNRFVRALASSFRCLKRLFTSCISSESETE